MEQVDVEYTENMEKLDVACIENMEQVETSKEDAKLPPYRTEEGFGIPQFEVKADEESEYQTNNSLKELNHQPNNSPEIVESKCLAIILPENEESEYQANNPLEVEESEYQADNPLEAEEP
ncbi:111_t:CDS:2, partial [Cetraspora pellucida]